MPTGNYNKFQKMKADKKKKSTSETRKLLKQVVSLKKM